MCYTLPKIWLGRIQKYWDKMIPADFPKSSSTFSLKFDEETKPAVSELENTINTEESPIVDMIPENNYVKNYIGVYDVVGTPNKLTLLSPEKVSTDDVIAIHYNKESSAWEKVEDAKVVDGYVWGTLTSFSPVAIVEVKKDIHVVEANDIIGKNCIVCEGNTTEVTTNEAGKIVVRNKNNSTEIELEDGMYIIGGSVDGSDIEKTSILIKDVEMPALNVFGGSLFYKANGESCKVGSVNVEFVNSIVRSVTGSSLMVRTESVNIKATNTEFKSHMGLGESWSDKLKKDVNKPDCNYASNFTLKQGNIELDGSKVELLFIGGNTGYTFTDNATIVAKESQFDYFITGPSNGKLNTVEADINNCDINIFQTVNRGVVESSKSKFVNSRVENLFVGGDATDNTVTGNTRKIKIDVNAGDGDYTVLPGVEGGKLITVDIVDQIVDTVKVSRNTTFNVDQVVSVLGDKLIIK